MNKYIVKPVLSTFVFLAAFTGATAQINADSLLMGLDTLQNDSARIDRLNKLAFEFTRKDYNIARMLADSSISLSKKTSNMDGLSNAFQYAGLSLHYLSDFQRALDYYDSARQIALILNDSIRLSSIYNNIGMTYRIKGDLDLALENFYLSMNYIKGDSNRVASRLGNIATIYFMQEKYTEAIEVFQQISQIFKQQGNLRYLISSYTNLAMCYMEMKDYEEAEHYNKEALKVAVSENDLRGQARAYVTLGRLAGFRGSFSEAIEYLLKGKAVAAEIGDKDILMHANAESGSVFRKTGETEKAVSSFATAINYAEELNAKPQLEGYYNEISGLYRDEGNFRKAYSYLILKNAISDSLMNEQKLKQIEELQTKYETEKKEQEISLLKTGNDLKQSEIRRQAAQRNWLIAFILAVMIIAVILFYYYKKTRDAKARIEELQREVHHRVKNNLAIIRRLVEVAEETVEDNKGKESLKSLTNRVSSMAEVHSLLYLGRNVASINLKEYLGPVCDNIEASLNDNRAELVRSIDSKAEAGFGMAVPLGLIINELLTNAFRHGPSGEEKARITLSVKQSDDRLILKVSDNGKGFPEGFSPEKSPSYGLKLVKSLARQLNGVIRTYNNGGANIEIEIPLTRNN
ncbi:MAG: tetratricopeptide repeat protein [Bacteroidales bacterium]|nr:tetratricopeptide repeat protein [Bacteroidales bacterium]